MSDSSHPPTTVRRCILVAVDAAAPLPEVLRAAATLAAEWQASLAGVFVEDVELLRAARLPCVCELDLTTAAVRPLEAMAVSRMLQQRAEGMRLALAQLADTSRIEWTFRVSQREIVQETLAAAAEVELSIVSRAARSFHSVRGQLARRSQQRVAAAPILAVFDGTAESRRTLLIAARLTALFDHHNKLVVVPYATDSTNADSLRDECRRLLAEHKIRLEFDTARVQDAAQLLIAARRWRSGWLVIGRHSPLLDEVRLRALAESLGHPLVLVGAAVMPTPPSVA